MTTYRAYIVGPHSRSIGVVNMDCSDDDAAIHIGQPPGRPPRHRTVADETGRSPGSKPSRSAGVPASNAAGRVPRRAIPDDRRWCSSSTGISQIMASEKVALVTAGGSGMGAAAARRLAADGFRVAILSSSGKGEALAARTRRHRLHRIEPVERRSEARRRRRDGALGPHRCPGQQRRPRPARRRAGTDR